MSYNCSRPVEKSAYLGQPPPRASLCEQVCTGSHVTHTTYTTYTPPGQNVAHRISNAPFILSACRNFPSARAARRHRLEDTGWLPGTLSPTSVSFDVPRPCRSLLY